MSTIRAHINSKRIATGRATKDGRFYQVFPTKMYYSSENIWRDEVLKTSKATFVVEDVKKPVENAKKSYEYSKDTIKTLPAGRYYIGDLCYSMKDDIYDGIYGDTAYSSGYYTTNDGCFMVSHTAYGDGSYKGSTGFQYGVDAGIIGIASLSLCNSENNIYGGTVHTFTEPVACNFKNGFFEFSSGNWYLSIDTAGDY